MFQCRFLGASVAVVFSWVLLAEGSARAAEVMDFDASTFAAAQSEGRPILLDISAWWCPVCASQNATIQKTVGAAEYDKLIVLHINYDRQQSIWKGLGVRKQATLIGFRGKQEIGRLSFVTDKKQIQSFLASIVS